MSLLPAKALAAAYNPKTQELTLSAEIELTRVTHGIVFRSVVPWFGAYKFALEGFQGEPQVPEISQISRNVPIPNTSSFLRTVLIETQDSPEGIPVEVRWLGLSDAPKGSADSASVSTGNESKVIPTVVPITEVLGKPFTLESKVNEFVFLDSKDERRLHLIGANIVQGRLQWQFLPVSPGHTSVSIRTESGLGGPVFIVDYLINILVPNVLTDGIAEDTKVEEASDGDNVVLSFVGKVNVVLNHVKKTYPDATVHSAREWTHDTHNGVASIAALFDLEVVLRISEKEFLIQQLLGSYFLKPKVIPAYIGVPDLKWPVEFQAEEALKILRERGVSSNFVEVELSMTVENGDPHFPSTWLYSFRLVDGTEERVQLLQ